MKRTESACRDNEWLRCGPGDRLSARAIRSRSTKDEAEEIRGFHLALARDGQGRLKKGMDNWAYRFQKRRDAQPGVALGGTSVRTRRLVLMPMLLLVSVMAAGCGSTPPQTVALSEIVGQDVQSLQISYRALIRTHYDSLRQQVNTFVDHEWAPVFLEEFITSGQLVERASQDDPGDVLRDVGAWVEKAIERIEERRQQLLAPIDEQERELSGAVDEAFARVMRANATVTAHLRSRVELEEEQDKLLEQFRMGELRERIESSLANASAKTRELIEKIRKADEMLPGNR